MNSARARSGRKETMANALPATGAYLMRRLKVFATETCVYPERFRSYAEAFRWRLSRWIDDDNSGNGNVHAFAGGRMPTPRCRFMEFFKRIAGSFKKIL